MEQILPDSLQGHTYIIPRTPERNRDVVQVIGLEDETMLFLADTLFGTIQRGETVQFHIGETTFVTSTQPISVTKILLGQFCDPDGDPSMLNIHPLNFPSGTAYFRTYNVANPSSKSMNLVVKSEGYLDTRINGISVPPELFSLVAHSTDWYAAEILLTDSLFEVTCPTPFVVYVYGLGIDESYAFKAGIWDRNPVDAGGPAEEISFCPGASSILHVSETFDTYQWSTGSTDSTLVASLPGIYWVDLSYETGCTVWRDSFEVQWLGVLDPGSLTADPICPALGETAFFSVADSYPIVAWSNGSDSSTALYTETGEAWVTLQNSFGCTDTFSFYVEEYCNPLDTLPPSVILDIPNAFSPNGDGANDVFIPLFTPATKFLTYQLEIYSRWGELIFQTNQPEQGWDGTFRAKEMPLGSYLYVVKFSTPSAPSRIQHGAVQLVR